VGLFDKLVNKTLDQVVGGVKDAVSQVARDAGVASFLGGGSASDGDAPVQPGQGTADGASTPASPDQTKDKDYFAAILARDFADYQVRGSVPVAELGGQGKPYEFGLYKTGDLKGVVVLVEHNRDRNRAYLGSKEAAQAAGVPFINFYLHMPNEEAFVVSRIRRMVKG